MYSPLILPKNLFGTLNLGFAFSPKTNADIDVIFGTHTDTGRGLPVNRRGPGCDARMRRKSTSTKKIVLSLNSPKNLFGTLILGFAFSRKLYEPRRFRLHGPVPLGSGRRRAEHERKRTSRLAVASVTSFHVTFSTTFSTNPHLFCP